MCLLEITPVIAESIASIFKRSSSLNLQGVMYALTVLAGISQTCAFRENGGEVNQFVISSFEKEKLLFNLFLHNLNSEGKQRP